MTKVKFLKNYLSYKKDTEVELEDDDATEMVTSKRAEKLEVTAEDEVATAIDLRINQAVKEAYKQGRKEAKSEMADNIKRRITVGDDNILGHPTIGYKNLGEYAIDAMRFYSNGQKGGGMATDAFRAHVSKATGPTTESTDGPAVPIEFSDKIITLVEDENEVFGNVDQYPTKTAFVKMACDALGNSTGVAGNTFGNNAVSGSWVASDGTAAIVTGAGLVKQLSFTLQKYFALAELTDEILADNNVMLDAFLTKVAIRDLKFQINNGVIKGNSTVTVSGGVGSVTGLSGLINAPGALTVAAYSSDEYVSGTGISFHDITAMEGAFYPTPSATDDSVVWLIGYRAYSQLLNMEDDSKRLISFAAGGIGDGKLPRMLGHKVIRTFHNTALGSVGDIILCDLKAYTALTRAEGVQAATSIHLYFLQDAMAFRWTYRTAGQLGITSPFTIPDGSGTQVSPVVLLGTRS
jgi:HK97 family phage major capsid protein